MQPPYHSSLGTPPLRLCCENTISKTQIDTVLFPNQTATSIPPHPITSMPPHRNRRLPANTLFPHIPIGKERRRVLQRFRRGIPNPELPTIRKPRCSHCGRGVSPPFNPPIESGTLMVGLCSHSEHESSAPLSPPAGHRRWGGNLTPPPPAKRFRGRNPPQWGGTSSSKIIFRHDTLLARIKGREGDSHSTVPLTPFTPGRGQGAACP